MKNNCWLKEPLRNYFDKSWKEIVLAQVVEITIERTWV